MPEKDHLRLTREELYSLVWAKPMTQVAQDFEISDRAMAKLCAKRQVPVPSRGYWARKKVGQNVPQIPLPAFAAKPAKARKDRVEPAEGAAGKPNAHGMFEERKRTIKTALKGFRNALSEAIDYTVRIEEWNCDYSFGLNSSYDPLQRDDGLSFLHESPFYEYRDLVLRGVFLAPAKLRDRKCEARLVRRAHLDKKAIEQDLHHYEESPPKCIGGFSKQNDFILEPVYDLWTLSAAVIKADICSFSTRTLFLGNEAKKAVSKRYQSGAVRVGPSLAGGRAQAHQAAHGRFA